MSVKMNKYNSNNIIIIVSFPLDIIAMTRSHTGDFKKINN